MDNAAGTMVIVDTASGTTLGSIKLQYVPAILRIDSSR